VGTSPWRIAHRYFFRRDRRVKGRGVPAGNIDAATLTRAAIAAPAPCAWEPANGLRKTLTTARDSTAEVVADGKVFALGLIVESDGLVVTKRPVLTGSGGRHRLPCRIAGGGTLDPRVRAESQPHDLTRCTARTLWRVGLTLNRAR
jgi:hypothetical protein